MAKCVVCNVCPNRGKLEDSKKVGQDYSDGRRFRTKRFTVWRCAYFYSIRPKEDLGLDEYYNIYYPLKQYEADMWDSTACRN